MNRRPIVSAFTMLTVAASLVVLPLTGDVSAQVTQLREGRTVAGALAAGDTIRYSFEAGEDFFLYGEVDQITVDVIVRLLDADGNQAGRWDTPRRGGERFMRRLREAGTWTIEVIPFEDETGDYTITLHRLAGRSCVNRWRCGVLDCERGRGRALVAAGIRGCERHCG